MVLKLVIICSILSVVSFKGRQEGFTVSFICVPISYKQKSPSKMERLSI